MNSSSIKKDKMQKRLLILNYEHHSNLGGTERYTKNLIDVLIDKGHKVFEIDFHPFQKKYLNENKNYEHIDHKIKMPKRNNRIINLPFIIFKFFWNTFKFNKLINKTIKNKKIDIVIDNTTDTIPYIKKKKVSYIWIAHFDIIKIYNEQKRLISKFKRWITLRPNKFKYKKIIVYTKNDKNALINIDKKINSNNIYFCPLAHKNLSEINNFNLQEKVEKAKKIVWLGRIDDNIKNIKFITKLAEKLINQLYIYIYMEMAQTKIWLLTNLVLNMKDLLKRIK